MIRDFSQLPSRQVTFDHLQDDCRRHSKQMFGMHFVDLVVTAANVTTPSAGGFSKGEYVAGEAITAGQMVYLKSSNSKWMMMQCDGTAEEAGSGVIWGMALCTGVLNQPLSVQTSGTLTPGATVTVARVYVVSAAYGGIAPLADIVTSTHRVVVIGIGATTSTIDMTMKSYTGYAIP